MVVARRVLIKEIPHRPIAWLHGVAKAAGSRFATNSVEGESGATILLGQLHHPVKPHTTPNLPAKFETAQASHSSSSSLGYTKTNQ